jgi:hypothetical protein
MTWVATSEGQGILSGVENKEATQRHYHVDKALGVPGLTFLGLKKCAV